MASDTAALGPPRIVNIEDLRRLAQRRLPRPVFDYLDGGADDETTLRENPRAFNDILFRPRNAIAWQYRFRHRFAGETRTAADKRKAPASEGGSYNCKRGHLKVSAT